MARRGRRSSGPPWALIGGLIAGGAAIIPLIPVLKKRAMQPATILKKDHRMVSGLIMALENTPRLSGTVRKSLFNEIHHQVSVHAQAEDEVLYPAMRNLMARDEEGKISEAYREHQIVKDLLHDMATIDPMTDAFDAKLHQLKNNIMHHVEEEEGELFPMMNARMSVDQRHQLGKRLRERKKDLKTRTAA
jgi:hemerythrin superfamily protein